MINEQEAPTTRKYKDAKTAKRIAKMKKTLAAKRKAKLRLASKNRVVDPYKPPTPKPTPARKRNADVQGVSNTTLALQLLEAAIALLRAG